MMDILYYLIIILQISGRNLYSLLPYIFAGILVSELLAYTSLVGLIQTHAVRYPRLCVFSSALLGVVSPLCTYGTVPVVIRLYTSGVPLAPLVVFLSASSMMNPQLFFLTLGGIGAGMAVVRLLFVLFFSLFLGILAFNARPAWVIRQEFLINKLSNEKRSAVERRKKFSWKAYIMSCTKSLEYIGLYLIIGVVAGAAIETLIPQQMILTLFKPQNWLSVLSASLLGIPLYACGGGVIPFMGSLINEGMSKGAALAFLTVGQATRVQPLIALATLFRPLSILVYIMLLILFSLAFGVVYG